MKNRYSRLDLSALLHARSQGMTLRSIATCVGVARATIGAWETKARRLSRRGLLTISLDTKKFYERKYKIEEQDLR